MAFRHLDFNIWNFEIRDFITITDGRLTLSRIPIYLYLKITVGEDKNSEKDKHFRRTAGQTSWTMLYYREIGVVYETK